MKNKMKLHFLTAMAMLLPLSTLSAASGTWTGGALTPDLTTPGNWSSATTPGVGDTATFATNAAMVTLSVTPTGTSSSFNPSTISFTTDHFDIVAQGNNTFSIASININTGVSNTSPTTTIPQAIGAVVGGQINFTGSSNADLTSSGRILYSADGTSTSFPGLIHFDNTSTASNANINIGGISAAGMANGIFSTNATAATAQITVENGNALTFENSSTAASSTILLNPMSIPSSGTTTVTFQDASNPASVTITSINGGSTTFDTSTSISTAVISLDTSSLLIINQDIEIAQLSSNDATDLIKLNGADLTINHGGFTVQTIEGQITGNGVLIKDGTFGLELTNPNNNYSGGTNILDGNLTAFTNSLPGTHTPTAVSIATGASLTFGDSTSGTFAGNITNDGTIIYYGDASSTISGNISGNGNLIVGTGMTPGQLTLTGTNSYTNGTTVSSGFKLVGNTNSLQGTISIDSSTLIFDQAFNGTFAGTITSTDNTAILNKNGVGTVTFSNPNAGFLGTTNINAGTLNLNALLGGNVNVLNSGILSGIGTVGGNLNLQSGSGIAPGNSIGTLTVNGNYTQASGSTYFLEINGLGQTDLILVNGTATLNGGQVVVTSLDGTALINTPYTILTATGGVTGQFTGVSTTNLMLTPTLSYNANNVFLTFAQTVFNFSAVTPNETAVALQLESITDPTAEEFLLLTTLAALPAEAQQLALNQMSGEQYTNAIVAAEIAGHQFIRRLYDPIRSIVTTQRCCEDLCCNSCPTFDVWLEGGGGRTFIKGDQNARGFHLDGYEVTGGVQGTFNRDWTAGIAGSYAEDKVDYKIAGNGKHQMAFVGLYGLYRPACWYAFADVAFGYHEHKTRRRITVGTLEYTTNSKPKIYEGSGYIEAGFDCPWNCFLIQPFLGFEADYFERDGFTETGVSPLNLVVSKKTHTNVHSRLGLHLTADQIPYNMALSFDIAWQYRLTSLKNSITERFESFGDTFTIRGSKFNRSSVDGAITLSTTVCDSWQIYLEASGERWSRASTYNFLGGVKFSW